MEISAGDGEVSGTTAGADTENKTAARYLIQRRRLLGQQHGLARRGQKDIGEKSDPFGCACRGRAHHQLLEVGISDSTDRGQRRESLLLRPACDGDEKG